MVPNSLRLSFLVVLVLSLATGEAVAQVVPTNAALQALPSTRYQSVTRLGFFSPGDGGRAAYVSSGSACSMNGGDGDGGSQVKAADGKCWLADFSTGPPSVKAFGSIGDGVTDDRSPLLSCLAFSVAQHAACRVPAGATLAVDDVTVPSGAALIGDGAQLSTIRRIAFSGNSNGVLHCGGCSNITISDLSIDGNKTNETVASSVVHFTKYSSVMLKSASISDAKGGNGIWLHNSSDQSASGLSTISDSLVYSNDANGILVTTAAYNLSLRHVVSNANGSYGFYAGPTGSANNVPDTLRYISIEGGEYSGNGNSGVAAQGYLTGYVGGQGVFGPGIWPVSDIKIRGVTANQNGTYGIVLQPHGGLVADSIANRNNTLEVNGGGVLPTCNNCEVSNVTANGNGVTSGVGFDAGFASGAYIHGGTIVSTSSIARPRASRHIHPNPAATGSGSPDLPITYQ
jgi:Right handed beta helix region